MKHDVIDSMGRTQRAKFITEGNLYRLITHSKLPKAEQFEKWVFDEVLPTIRQTGGYGSQTAGLTKLAEQMAQATIAMVQVASAMTTVVDKLTGLVDKMSSHPITLEGELDSTPRLFRSSTANCLKLETFPDEIVDEVDRMLALMREQQALNFSQIARFCTMNGYTISSPSVKRYFDRHFQEVSDGQR